MNQYYVGISIYNSFCVTAEDEEHAEEIVQGMYAHNLLDNSELNINYIDEAPSV